MRSILLILLLSGAISTAHADSPDVTVIDGDKFVFEGQHYQIFGIKSPAKSTPHGEQAKDRLTKLLIPGFDLIPARNSQFPTTIRSASTPTGISFRVTLKKLTSL